MIDLLDSMPMENPIALCANHYFLSEPGISVCQCQMDERLHRRFQRCMPKVIWSGLLVFKQLLSHCSSSISQAQARLDSIKR